MGVWGLTSTALLLIHFHTPPPTIKNPETPLLGYDCKICCACVALLRKVNDGMQ